LLCQNELLGSVQPVLSALALAVTFGVVDGLVPMGHGDLETTAKYLHLHRFSKQMVPDRNLHGMAHLALPTAVQPFCVWTCGSRQFAIHLLPDVLERLGIEAWTALKRVPGRGLEIGGVLLGRVDTSGDSTTFWVHGFQSVESEYRSGPSYLLSEFDLAQLRKEIEKSGPESIGIFRSQTRSEQLSLAETDVETIVGCFGSGDALFLLLGSAPVMAAFFIRMDGEIHRVHEFALASSLATLMNLKQRRPSAPIQPPPPPPNSSTSVVRQLYPVVKGRAGPHGQGQNRGQASESGFKGKFASSEATVFSGVKRVHWIAGAIAFLALAAAASRFIESLRPYASPSRQVPQVLRLNVHSAGPLLRLHWEPNDPGVRGAVRAILHVQDGDEQSARDLTPSEFLEGSVTYAPKNADITFRLDVYPAEPKASGFVQVVNLAPPPAIAPSASGAPNPNPPLKNQPASPQASDTPLLRTVEKSQPAASIAGAPMPSLRGPAEPASRDFSLPSATPAAPKAPDPRPPATHPEGSPQAVRTMLSPADARTSETSQRPPIADRTPALPPQPSVRISMELVSGSRLGGFVERVPLLRRLRKQDETVAPVPVYQAQPSLKAPALSLIRPVSIGIKIDVNESGAVTYAEVADYGDPPNFTLVNASLAAAQRWTFMPARLRDAAVSSQAILHFNFAP
jgi:hypothetical protein